MDFFDNMSFGGWIVFVVFGLISLAIATSILHFLYRKVLEHFFREYDFWRKCEIPDGCLVVEHISMDSRGLCHIQFRHRYGWFDFTCNTSEALALIAGRLSERMSEVMLKQKKAVTVEEVQTGKKYAVFSLRFDEVNITFPTILEEET